MALYRPASGFQPASIVAPAQTAAKSDSTTLRVLSANTTANKAGTSERMP